MFSSSIIRFSEKVKGRAADIVSDSWQKKLDIKIDRIINDLEFIKNRTAIYLGRNEALTYLADETPIFVNTDDFGCPVNFLNGGKYEEEYLSVLQSFRNPDTVFLDIGANLGVYSLRLAPFLRRGRIIAFEPLSRIRSLFSRSVFLNGYGGHVTIQPHALSDQNGEAALTVPGEHAGGASLESMDSGMARENVTVRRLDDLMPGDFTCHLVKLDVEGHELSALRGMQRIMSSSPSCVVMFEKLAVNSGIEAGLADYAQALGWSIYAIDGIHLSKVDLPAFRDKGGYFVAGRPEAVEKGGLKKNFFNLFPADMNVLHGAMRGETLHVEGTHAKGTVLFHGPYIFLPRGYYRITLDGDLSGAFQLDLCERFGYKVAELELRGGQTSIDVPIPHDLCKFEFVLRATGCAATLDMRKIQMTRIG